MTGVQTCALPISGHALFLLITSRLNALPVTIRSRCQQLRFSTPARTQVEAAVILTRELPPADARLLALVTEGRIGEALTQDIAALREWQQECLAIVAPATLRSIGTILTLAESLAKSDRGIETLNWLSRWTRDLLLVHVGGDRDQILHLEQMAQLQDYARTTDLTLLLDLIKEIERAQQNATRNLNLHMALESCLLKLREAIGLAPASTPA